MKLYVKNIVREPKDTLYTFLCRVLNFNDDGFAKGTVNTTYFDPEFTKLQCNRSKYRSFDEILLISKTYFKVSNKAVAKVIKKLLDTYPNAVLVLCDSIHKWVFYYGLTESDDIKYCARYNKSNYKTNDCEAGKYSFDDIITLMGLTKEDVKINN